MNDTSTTQLPDSLLVYDWANNSYEPMFYKFGAEGPIVLKNLELTEHIIFALANMEEEEIDYITLAQTSIIDIQCRRKISLPDLIGGIVYTNGSSASETMKMTRLVGGISVNILNRVQFPDAQEIKVVITNILTHTLIGETTIEFSRLNSEFVTDGSLNYLLPTDGPVSGEVRVYGESYEPSVYRFTAQHGVEVNKKLDLNLTLDTAPGARSGNSAVVCSEKVSNL